MKKIIILLCFFFVFSSNLYASTYDYYINNFPTCSSIESMSIARNSALIAHTNCDSVPITSAGCSFGQALGPTVLKCYDCNTDQQVFNGQCVPSCPSGSTHNTATTCICSDGFSPTGSPLTCDRPMPVCQSPQVQVTTSDGTVICGDVCTGGQFNNASGACVCGAGMEMFNGSCRQVCLQNGGTNQQNCIAPCLTGQVRIGPGGTCLNPSDLCAVCYNYDPSAHTCVPDTNQNCAKTGYQDPDQLDQNGIPGDGSVKKPGTAGDPTSVDNTPKKPDDATNTAKTGEGSGTGTNSHKRGLSSPDCKTTPECSSENPIECAQLRQTWNLMCYSVPFDPADIQSYIDNNPGSDVVKTDSGSYEISDKFSAALHSNVSTEPGCPAPKTFTVMGHTYSISLDLLCYAAHMFSYVVVFAFTMLSTQNFYNTVFRDK